MSTLTYQMYHGYHIGTDHPLSERQLHQLRICFEKPPLPAGEVLAGRQGATIVHLENMGSVAVKHYARGGLIRHVNHCAYVNWPCTRGEKEFRWLATVRQLGLAAPRPIVFASTGRFVGQCWLVTAAIPRPYPLTRIGQQQDRLLGFVEVVDRAEATALAVEEIRIRLNPKLCIQGVVLTMYDGRTNLAKDVRKQVNDFFGDKAYRTLIPRSVRLSEAPSYGEPIETFDPMSRGGIAYRQLTREFRARHGRED